MRKPKWPKTVEGFIVPIYSGTIYPIANIETYNRCKAALGNPDEIKLLGGCVTYLENDKTGEAIYLLGVFDHNISTLVHETGHLAFYVLDRAGIPIESGKANEAYCYLLDTLFDKAVDFYEF